MITMLIHTLSQLSLNKNKILSQARINKRGRKLVDYDRYRHNLEVSLSLSF